MCTRGLAQRYFKQAIVHFVFVWNVSLITNILLLVHYGWNRQRWNEIEHTLIESVTNKWLNSFLPIFRLEKMCFETEFYILSIMVSLFDESKLAFHMPKGPLFLSWVDKKLAL